MGTPVAELLGCNLKRVREEQGLSWGIPASLRGPGGRNIEQRGAGYPAGSYVKTTTPSGPRGLESLSLSVLRSDWVPNRCLPSPTMAG